MITGAGIYLLVGLFAGFMGGLLGVGGGTIILPGLLIGFAKLGWHDNIAVHTALGTSLASIIFTSLSSVKAHHERGYVRWDILKQITPGVLLGTFIGTQIVGFISARPLQWIVIVLLLAVAVQMLLGVNPKTQRGLLNLPGMSIAGSVIGFVSSFIGIGGGSLSMPFMNWCSVPAREAIATSAAIALPVAFAGAMGNVVSGWGQPDLPAWSLGFVYLPALGLVAVASMPMARVGAKLAHRLPAPVLKKVFAVMLICVVIDMFNKV